MDKRSAIPSTGPDFQHLLAQDVVIAAGGAQQLGVGARPRTGEEVLPTAPLAAGADLQREVEQFLYRQAEFLDGKHWQAYIDLFDAQGVYWMPVAPDQTEWEGSPSIFAEDKPMMEIRKGRVGHPNAWSQAPDWETSHLVSHVMLESAGAEIVVRSRFHMMELRRDEIRHFGGRYRHTLVRDAQGQLRIRLQRVDLFNGQAPYDYVLQIWV